MQFNFKMFYKQQDAHILLFQHGKWEDLLM